MTILGTNQIIVALADGTDGNMGWYGALWTYAGTLEPQNYTFNNLLYNQEFISLSTWIGNSGYNPSDIPPSENSSFPLVSMATEYYGIYIVNSGILDLINASPSPIIKFYVASYNNNSVDWGMMPVTKTGLLSDGYSQNLVNNFFPANPCFAWNSYAITEQGIKLVEDIKKGDILFDINGKQTEIINNVYVGTTDVYYVIGDEQLHITGAHPVNLNGKVVLAKDVGIKKIMGKMDKIYTFITKEKTYVKLNGVWVATWAEVDWNREKNKFKCPKLLQ